MSDKLNQIAEGVERIEKNQKKSQELLEHQVRDTKHMRDSLVELIREVSAELEELREQRHHADKKLFDMETKLKALDAKVTQLAAMQNKCSCKNTFMRFVAWFVGGASVVGIVLSCVWLLFRVRMESF